MRPALAAGLALLLALAEPASAHGQESHGAGLIPDGLPGALTLTFALVTATGSVRLISATRDRALHGRNAALLAAGVLLAGLAVIGPIPAAARESFTAHMIEHELLMVGAAPLIVLSRPLAAFVTGLPRAVRPGAASVIRSARRLSVLARPGTASLIHGLALWIWHVPAFFRAAEANAGLHALQHVSFLGSALLFWAALLPMRRPAADQRGAAVLHLALTSIHAGALGALLVFSGRPWFAEPGPDALNDQVLAGLVMWVIACSVYALAALGLLAAWIRESGTPAWEPRP